MRWKGRIIPIVALGLALAACRAEVGNPDDLGDDGGDQGVPDDLDQPDLVGADLACSGPSVPEICGNGCDDDHNGYTDLDDPACSTQLIVTMPGAGGSASLSRLVLDPMPHLSVLDSRMISSGGMAMYNGHLSAGNAFLVFTAGSAIEKLTLSGPVSTYTPMPTYPTRDVCTFNGELVVLERNNTSVLHRLMPDGKTEIGTASLGSVLATACASDGKLLYVAVHAPLVTSVTSFMAFDNNYNQQGAAIPMPDGIANFGPGGINRCVDFAWSPHSGFWGLFVDATMFANDNAMYDGQLFPFAMDGGSGAPLDAGVYYGVGEFIP